MLTTLTFRLHFLLLDMIIWHPQSYFRPLANILVTDLEQRNGRKTDTGSAVAYLRSKGVKVED